MAKKLNITISDFAHRQLRNMVKSISEIRGEKINNDTAIELILEGLVYDDETRNK